MVQVQVPSAWEARKTDKALAFTSPTVGEQRAAFGVLRSAEQSMTIEQAAEKEFESYYAAAQTYKTIMPNVVGLPAMDAISLLENMGLKVKLSGSGIVKKQSLTSGQKIDKNQTVVLEVS